MSDKIVKLKGVDVARYSVPEDRLLGYLDVVLPEDLVAELTPLGLAINERHELRVHIPRGTLMPKDPGKRLATLQIHLSYWEMPTKRMTGYKAYFDSMTKENATDD
jgi:hypothetical protein